MGALEMPHTEEQPSGWTARRGVGRICARSRRKRAPPGAAVRPTTHTHYHPPSLTHNIPDARQPPHSPPAPVKKSLFGRARPSTPPPAPKKKSAPILPKQSILEAFDFSQVRSQDDAELIARARGMKAGQKMVSYVWD
jgi:type IV secretory pathway VirB10-like protein